MIGRMMAHTAPGSFVWLTLNELRLAMLAYQRKDWQAALAYFLLVVWTLVGIVIALAMRGVPLDGGPFTRAIVLLVSAWVFTLMVTQAIVTSQRTLYEAGDLDLLFSAPLPPRTVIAAKLAGITGSIMLTYATILLPIVLPMALLGHAELLGAVALLVALALFGACSGLAITLALARIAGPRAARTVGQIAAALSGGAAFLVIQFYNSRDRDEGGIDLLFRQIERAGLVDSGPGAWPGHAALGDPIAVLFLFGGAALIFAFTAWAMQTLFLSGYRAGGMRLSGRTRAATSRIARHFRAGLFATTFAKEWRLLARDPALIFQILLRLVYLAPIFFIGMQSDGAIPIGPSLAFVSVIVAGQVVSSLAWLAAAAEDSPDLITVAPVTKDDVDSAKLLAALAMSAPVVLLLPIVIAFETIPGALVTIAITALGGWLTGYLEVSNATPAPRSTFQRKSQGSFVMAIFNIVISAFLGAIAGVAVYFL